jgi:anti-anti-sigma regulatory factor
MFKVTFDQPRNCLTIAYSGHVDADETRRCAEEIRLGVAKIKPGFRLLVDMTDLQAMEVSCAPHIRNLMDMCNQNGVAKVIRIIPNPKLDIGFQIMSYFHYGGDVHIVTCESLDEAMNLLAK